MADYGDFQLGAVLYPLDETTGDSLLADADPATFYLLEFAAAMLTKHLEPRLLAQKTAAGASHVTAAVAYTLPWNPETYLREQHVKFPLLAAHRKSSTYDERTMVYPRATSLFEVVYVLPPMRSAEAEHLVPALRAAEAILVQRFIQGWDPDHAPTGGNAGDKVWTTHAGIERVRPLSATFGSYQATEQLAFPCVVLEVEVRELFKQPASLLDELESAGLAVDVVDPSDDTTVSDVVEAEVDLTT